MSPTVALLLLLVASLAWGLLLIWRPSLPLRSGLVAVGGLATLGAGIAAVGGAGAAWYLPAPLALGTVRFALHLDPLAGWFLAVMGLIAAASGPYLPSYLAHLAPEANPRTFWPCLSLLLASMAGVVLAANAPTFLVAWEVMSLSSFVLVATDTRLPATRQAALVYLGATRVGTAALMGGFLWAHAASGSWTFADWHLTGVAALGPGLLVLLGLGVKAGMWPFHLWLPIAHPAAPSPVSALMSGVMVKVAIYAMVRLLVLSPAFAHPALGGVVLLLGAISAFWGVLFALLQDDLKRLLAYSTVENVGLILMALGAAMLARDLGLGFVARVALAAGLLHVLNHAVFKSLLFLGAGAVDLATGTRDLAQLGGLGARLPTTFACFLVGSAAICALPPLNGFSGEWLLYQSLLGLAGGASTPVARFGAMLLLGWVALVGALALACFVKAAGVAFLGRPRSERAEQAHEVPLGMRVSQVVLASACVVLGLLAPVLLGWLGPVVAALEPGGVPLAAAWTLPTGLLALVLLVTVGAGALWLQTASRTQPTRAYITWECGFGDLSPRMQVTAGSFAQPVLRMFGFLMHYATTRRVVGDRLDLFPRRITVEPSTEAVLEQRVYRPALHWIDQAGGLLGRLQTGSIHTYLLAMMAVLLLLLVIGRVVP